MSITASSGKTVLLIGGHGKIAQLLTPLLLSRGHRVTSLIRDAAQTPAIEALGRGGGGGTESDEGKRNNTWGQLTVLVRSLEGSDGTGVGVSEAEQVLREVAPEWVIWSAGAGGRGGASRTHAVDNKAATSYTVAAVQSPTVRKFLTVSYIASRRARAPWWDDADWSAAQHVNTTVLPHYFAAKVAADEVLTVAARRRVEQERETGKIQANDDDNELFCGISLRPGTLTDEPAGRVSLGKTKSRGSTSRATVAAVALACLERRGLSGWVDVLDGEQDVALALDRYAAGGLDAVEGEDWDGMLQRVGPWEHDHEHS